MEKRRLPVPTILINVYGAYFIKLQYILLGKIFSWGSPYGQELSRAYYANALITFNLDHCVAEARKEIDQGRRSPVFNPTSTPGLYKENPKRKGNSYYSLKRSITSLL